MLCEASRKQSCRNSWGLGGTVRQGEWSVDLKAVILTGGFAHGAWFVAHQRLGGDAIHPP